MLCVHTCVRDPLRVGLSHVGEGVTPTGCLWEYFVHTMDNLPLYQCAVLSDSSLPDGCCGSKYPLFGGEGRRKGAGIIRRNAGEWQHLKRLEHVPFQLTQAVPLSQFRPHLTRLYSKQNSRLRRLACPSYVPPLHLVGTTPRPMGVVSCCKITTARLYTLHIRCTGVAVFHIHTGL